MIYNYKQYYALNNEIYILEKNSGMQIPNDPANADYQAYLEWLAEGNTPEPPDEPEETP
jgi:hypothetical protein